ncbi:unnamed protein product [marine sediment metagenome]|uniref:Uncharacterized protein n=1 Tax=marine sediment metagenome TaxID=412755 RepID=X0ZK33_9ZZZZ
MLIQARQGDGLLNFVEFCYNENGYVNRDRDYTETLTTYSIGSFYIFRGIT